MCVVVKVAEGERRNEDNAELPGVIVLIGVFVNIESVG
jgi:hypothetical protein